LLPRGWWLSNPAIRQPLNCYITYGNSGILEELAFKTNFTADDSHDVRCPSFCDRDAS
jgi:hypothetical protein